MDKWKARFRQVSSLDEVESLALMSDFDLPVVPNILCGDSARVVKGATIIGYPLVMKTAEPGIQHKSDVGGVVVGRQVD